MFHDYCHFRGIRFPDEANDKRKQDFYYGMNFYKRCWPVQYKKFAIVVLLSTECYVSRRSIEIREPYS